MVRSAATICAGQSVSCLFLFLYLFWFLGGGFGVGFWLGGGSDRLVMRSWRVFSLFFSHRRDYCLIKGKDGIDVGDGMVDLDLENLVHG